MSARQRQPAPRGRNRQGGRQRGRGGGFPAPRRDASQLPDEPKQLDKFSPEDWDTLIKKTGVLRAWREKGDMARSQAVAIDPQAYGRFHQCQNTFSQHLLERSGAQEEGTEQSRSTDKGLELNAGADLAAARPGVGGSVSRQNADAHSSNQAATSTNESHQGSFVGATMWLHPENLILSNASKEFFNRHWDAKLANQTSIPSSGQQPAKAKDIECQRALLRDFEDRFGSTFHQTVRLGVSREKVAASQRHDTSRQLDHSRSRQNTGQLTVEAPGALVTAGAHYNPTKSFSATASGSHRDQGSIQRSYGGAASLAHSDEDAWLNSHSDPQNWAIIQNLSADSISVLQLVLKIARAQRSSGNPQIVKVFERSQCLLLRLLRDISATAASQHAFDVFVRWSDLGKGKRSVTFSIKAHECIDYITLRSHQTQDDMCFTEAKAIGNFYTRSIAPPVGDPLIIYLAPGWRCQPNQSDAFGIMCHSGLRFGSNTERDSNQAYKLGDFFLSVRPRHQQRTDQSIVSLHESSYQFFPPASSKLGDYTVGPFKVNNPELFDRLCMADVDDGVQSLTL